MTKVLAPKLCIVGEKAHQDSLLEEENIFMTIVGIHPQRHRLILVLTKAMKYSVLHVLINPPRLHLRLVVISIVIEIVELVLVLWHQAVGEAVEVAQVEEEAMVSEFSTEDLKALEEVESWGGNQFLYQFLPRNITQHHPQVIITIYHCEQDQGLKMMTIVVVREVGYRLHFQLLHLHLLIHLIVIFCHRQTIMGMQMNESHLHYNQLARVRPQY